MKAKTLNFLAVSALALAVHTFAQDANAPAAAETKPATEAARPAAEPLRDDEKGLRLNFRGAALEQVLNYMSDAAGFIINVLPGTDVKGKVDVWSSQPLTKEEAVELLNTILHQNGLAAIRTGRTLSIISRDTAKTNKDVPVKQGADPQKIPRSDEMVTQIIPVKYVNAGALVQNLQPLLPEYAQNGLSANEAGNSLILTASQTDVRRMAEIVTALDQAISNVSEIKVFPLKFADAKTLVEAVKELFTPPAAQNQTGRGGRGEFFQNLFGGGGGGGGGGPFGGGGGGRGGFPNGGNFGSTGSRGNTSASAARVVAVADERSNSLIVAAASEAMPEIDRLVKEIDVEVDEVTEIRLFPLTNSDPNDVVEILAQLFPDPTTSNQQQGGGRFGGFRGGFGGQFGGGGGFNRGQQTTQSQRAAKQSRVISVADARTSSVIVTAARDIMPEIEKMIRQLDANRRGRQRVYVYNLENADVTQVEQIVRDMFDRSNNGRNNNQQQSALTSRQQQTIQQQGANTGGGIGQGTRGGNNLGGAFSQ
jgi:type II secretory pathway component GspD/PulD (secretin)